jgi:hypothetical protein
MKALTRKAVMALQILGQVYQVLEVGLLTIANVDKKLMPALWLVGGSVH